MGLISKASTPAEGLPVALAGKPLLVSSRQALELFFN
jgi:hypothetical protein